ncbi:MAG: hypothetical protein JWO83_4624 [Caulobacteraceae bacterium]|nr:hypothetical protein [Caulobacteraceae bacterium]
MRYLFPTWTGRKILDDDEVRASAGLNDNGTPQPATWVVNPPCGAPPKFEGALLVVRAVGVEPTLLSEPDFESGASANSATPAGELTGRRPSVAL